MFKTSKLFDDLHYPATDSLTPIRDYKNDYFHRDDNKLPNVTRFPVLNNSTKISSHLKDTTNFYENIKRPASLDLSEIGEPLNKKLYSPLNLDRFQKVVQLETPTNEGTTVPLLDIIRRLYESELEYAEFLTIADSAYRLSLIHI